ncbi:hypothetical protein Tco_1316582 [Tanacetum coccineum]
MQIPAWMITEEMKHTEHYRMYAKVFGIDVPLTQSQPTESTQGTHRTTSAPRSTLLHHQLSAPNVDKAYEMILQYTLQVSLAEHKKNVVDDSSIPRNDESNIHGTRIEPRSNKESLKVEITKDKEVEITKETLMRREKGKIVEETRNSPIPTPIRSPRIHTNLVSSDTEKLQELTDTHTTSSSSSPHTKLSKTNPLLSLFKSKPTRFKHYKSFFQELQGCYGYLYAHLRARFMLRKSFDTLADNLYDVMVETLPTMIDKHIKEQVMKQVPEQVRNQVPVYVVKGLILERKKAKEETERLIAKAIITHAVRRRDQEDHLVGCFPERRLVKAAKDIRVIKSKMMILIFGLTLMLQMMMKYNNASISRHYRRSIANIDEASLRKMADEMLRKVYFQEMYISITCSDENFLKSDIVLVEYEKKFLSLPSRKTPHHEFIAVNKIHEAPAYQ